MALTQKEIDEMARATIRGDYGNGSQRKQNLGANYDAVQKRVNEIKGGANTTAPSTSSTKTTTKVSTPKANANSNVKSTVKTVSKPKSAVSVTSNGGGSASNKPKQTGNATQTTKSTTVSTKSVKTQNTGTITVQKLDGSTKKVANGTVTIPSLDKKYKTNTVNTERARKKYEQKIGHTASENILTDEDNKAISMAVSNLGTGKQFEDYLDVFTPTKGLQEKYGMSARELLDMYNKDKERKDNDFANKHKVVGTALASAKNIVQKPVLSGATVLSDLVNPEISKKSEEMYGNTLRQVTGDVANLKGGVTRDMSNVGKTAYNMGTGLAENLIPKALGTPFWVATSALNAAGDSMLSAQDRGVDKRKAAGEGLVSGAIDAALNVKGLDAIKGLQSTGSTGKDLLKQMTIGGGEQAITEIAQKVADSIIAGDDSIAKTTYNNYKAQGLDDDTAFLNTVKDMGGEFLTNVGTGALIGGAIGSGRKLLSDVVNPRIPSIFTPENRVDAVVDNAETPNYRWGRTADRLIPQDSYARTPEYMDLDNQYKANFEQIEQLKQRRTELNNALATESAPKPREEWNTQDEIQALLGDTPMNYTENGNRMLAELDGIKRNISDLESRNSLIKEDRDLIKGNTRVNRLENYTPKEFVPATRENYQGFSTTKGVHNDLVQSGKAQLVEMSPEEYIRRCADEIFKDDVATLESVISSRDQKNIDKYAQMMKEGTEFDTPYLDYDSSNQEGLHRALAAYEAGLDVMPVVVKGTPETGDLDFPARNRISEINNARFERENPIEDMDIDDEILFDDIPNPYGLPRIDSVISDIKAKEQSGAKITDTVEKAFLKDDVLDTHSPQKVQEMNDYIDSVDKNVVEFIKRNRNGEKLEPISVGNVTNRAANAIRELTGIETLDNAIMLDNNGANHIEAHHGSNGDRDHTMSDDLSVGRMNYVLDNFDKVTFKNEYAKGYFDKNGKPAPKVVFYKKVDGTYYVVEAVSDSKTKRNYIISAYTNDNVHDIKKGVTLSPPNESVDSLGSTPDSGMTITPFGKNVPQASGDVNIPNPSQLAQPDAVPVRNLPSPELFNEVGDTFNPPRNLDTDSPNGKVSKTRTNTMANSGIMTDEELAKYSPENLFTYEEVSEKRSVGEALDMIRRESPQKVASDLLNSKKGLTGVETDALMTLWDSAVRRAQELDAQGYDSKEQWDLANKLFKKVQTEQTRGGQAMQAMAKWSRNTPTGLLAEANRVINNYGKADDSKWQKEFKKYSQKDAKDLDPNFTKLFLNLANQYSALAPDSRQAKEIMAKMGRLVNSQLPSKLSERVVTGLMDNMLGNFRTLITRNAGGNIGFGALEQLKKPIASGVDTLLSKKTGKKTVANLSKDSIAEYLKGFGSGFADEIADIKSGLHTARSGENDLGTAVANNRHVFIDKGSILPDGAWNTITDTKAVKLASKVLDKADSLVHNGLSIGDRPFYEGTYRQTLQEYKDLRKKGAMGSIVQSLSDAEFENYAKTAAKLNALGAVYQDDTVLARGLMDAKNAVSDISKGVLGVDVLSQFSMPFVKTPANLVTRAIEYSPFGLVKNTANTIKEGFQPNSNGKTRFDFNNLDQQRVANETARNILGTGLWAGALGLASAGGLTGAYSDDKDMKEAQKNKGMQEYALAFDDGKKNMDISWIPVLGNNAVAAAATYDAVRKNPQDSVLGTIGTGAKEGLKSLLNQSVFQGMQELFGGNSSYNNEEGIVGNVVDTIKGGVSQAIPSLSRQLGQVIDPYERNVANGDNEYWQNSVLSAIPSERMKMQPKVNTEGEYVLQNQGRPIPSKILENMILPGKVTQITDSTVNDEAMRIFNENGGDKTAFIPKASRKDLGDDVTDEKFTEYSSKFGKANAEIGKGLIQSDVYNKLSDSAKSNLLSDAYSAIKASLKQEYNKDYTSDDAYAKAFTEGGTPALLDKLLTKTEYNYVMESNGRDTKENLDNVGFYLSTLGDLSPEEKAKAFLDVYKGGDPEKLKHGKKKKDGTYEDGAYEYYQKGDWQKVLDEYDIPQYSTQGNASNIEISVEPSKSNKPSANAPMDEVAMKHSQGDYSDQLRGVTESGNQADWVDAEKAIPFLDKNFATSSPEARGEILWNSGTNHSKTLNTVKDTYGMSGVNDYYTYFYEANADGNSKVSKDEAIAYLNTTDLSAKEKNFWYHRLVPTSKKDIW